MQKVPVARIATAGLIVSASIAFFITQMVAAQSTCLAGQRLATADDVAKGLATTVGVSCVDSATAIKLNGGCSFDPYPVINGFRANSGVLLTPQLNSGGAQDGINPILACRLAQFLQYAQSQGHSLKIESGFRSAQKQTDTCMSICRQASCQTPKPCAPAGTSCHQYGLAVDLSGSGLQWAESYLGFGHPGQGASQYRIFFPLGSDQGHLQCIENTIPSCNANTVGCGGGNFQITGAGAAVAPLQGLAQLLGLSNGQQCSAGYTMVNGVCTPQTGTYITPGIGSTPQPGQILSQDYYCLVSTNPVVTVPVPAGTPFPAGCLNSSQAYSTCPVQSYCSGNTIMSQSSMCTVTAVQTCPYGCSNGTCMQQQSQQATPASASAASTPASAASAPASTASTQSTAGTSAVSPTSGTSNTTGASTIASPALVPNLLTPSSTAAILQALANPQIPTTTPATTTPIVLNSAVADNIAQLQANAPLGVTYAEPASAYFPSNGNGQLAGSAPAQSGTTGGAGNAITTTPGTGYDMAGAAPAPNAAGPIASDITSPSGVDTFTSSDAGSNQSSQDPFDAASTFNSGPLSILAALKAEVLGAINFLAVYTEPFGGNVPSQMNSE